MWMASTKYINFLFAMCSMLWCCIKKKEKKEGKIYINFSGSFPTDARRKI